MNDIIVARALHIVGVVIWIGGVAFVTTVLLPAVKKMKEPQERVQFFEDVESRFAWQARLTTLIVGVSGFYIIHVWDLWSRFQSAAYWWMHAMVIVWTIFSVMLFLAEPLFLHRWFLKKAAENPERTFRLIERMHWFLLTISMLTTLGAVAGSHGLIWP